MQAPGNGAVAQSACLLAASECNADCGAVLDCIRQGCRAHASTQLSLVMQPPEMWIECSTSAASQQLVACAQQASLAVSATSRGADQQTVSLRGSGALQVSSEQAPVCKLSARARVCKCCCAQVPVADGGQVLVEPALISYVSGLCAGTAAAVTGLSAHCLASAAT